MIALGWSSLALLGLGALHGANPAMGWLFAVAQGLQAGERGALWRALLAVAAGHALAIAAALAVAAALGQMLPLAQLRWLVVAVLVLMGWRFLRGRHPHPRFGGMRMRTRTLVLWSFVVATAHGAGVMVIPLVPITAQAAPAPLSDAAAHGAHGDHAAHLGQRVDGVATAMPATMATIAHTVGYIVAAALLALLMFESARWRLLRAWVNLDRIWGGALLVTALAIAWS